MKRYEKVFGIGLNKTGTTSLASALTLLGFRTSHWQPGLVGLHKRQEHNRLDAYVDRFDAFTDWPWPLMVDQLLDTYGARARFVLTKRSSAQRWLDSLKRHALRSTGMQHPRKHIFGYEYPHENEQAHLEYYERHNAHVRELFRARGAQHLLIEACWEEGDSWFKLCDFLDKPFPDAPFPHENRGHQTTETTLTTLRNLARYTQIRRQYNLSGGAGVLGSSTTRPHGWHALHSGP